MPRQEKGSAPAKARRHHELLIEGRATKPRQPSYAGPDGPRQEVRMPIRLSILGLALAAGLAAPAGAAQKTLYERLGGQEAIVAVVDDFVANLGADKRINHFFIERKSDAKHVKEKLVEQIC